ncbi:F-box/LRR-repeat protein 25 [Coffea arabica]|uniref:F-box/LRR-repeat protein 25 n=1 Tax=Coffea arabica TaxID=13443 RepID=A0A6P6S8J3_COFAR|nr:putative F-box/LRR-repeat protein At3g28410 [Coffea arabica]
MYVSCNSIPSACFNFSFFQAAKMDFKNDDEDEGTATCSRFEKLKKSEDQQDLFSGLPDEILLHILSFLPLEDAVKTVLIRRFGNLWRSIRILDFDQCLNHSCYNGPYCNQKLMNLIHQGVKFNESRTLEKLRLKFAFHKGYDSILEDQWLKSTANEIDSLVRFAVSKKVKVLDLDLLGCGFIELVEDYSVPDVVFRNDHLMELRLAACNIELQGEISLKSVKILSLKDIELNDNMMEKILLGCPSLEDLTLIGCYGLTNLNCSNNPNLKKLNLVLHLGKTLTISWNAALSVENPKCLEGGAKQLNLPSAIDASLFIGSRFRWERKKHNEVKRQLQKTSFCSTCTPSSSSCILA